MSKKLFYNQLKEQEKELNEALLAVRALMKHYDSDAESKPQTSLEFKEEKHNINVDNSAFDKNWTIPDKILYSLKQLDNGQGLVTDVASMLIELDSSFSKDRAKKACTHHLSLLYGKGVIEASKIGMKYKYSIKKEANSL